MYKMSEPQQQEADTTESTDEQTSCSTCNSCNSLLYGKTLTDQTTYVQLIKPSWTFDSLLSTNSLYLGTVTSVAAAGLVYFMYYRK